MIVHQFSDNSITRAIPFDKLEDVARLTLPFLQKRLVALSGGSTYSKLFPLWISLNPSCGKTTFFPVDERRVALNSPESNWGTALKQFLGPLKRPDVVGDAALDAQQYQGLLEHHFEGSFPVFDSIFLGVGDDGHTASLFPKSSALKNWTSWILETQSPKPPHARITFAPSLLRAARSVVVILSGQNKKGVADAIFKNDPALPIVKILSARSESFLFLQRNFLPS